MLACGYIHCRSLKEGIANYGECRSLVCNQLSIWQAEGSGTCALSEDLAVSLDSGFACWLPGVYTPLSLYSQVDCTENLYLIHLTKKWTTVFFYGKWNR